MKKKIPFICLLILLPVFSSGQKIVTGETTEYLDNTKDIYHPKNRHYREQMIEAAVMDAIEKGSLEKISVTIDHTQINSSNSQSYEEVFEELVSKSLIEQHVEWRRTSSYMFDRDTENKKKWICMVEGEIRSVEGNYKPSETSNNSISNSLNNFITRKSYNIAYLNAGKNRDVKEGDKFVTYEKKRLKNVGGAYWIPKNKGYILVTHVYDRFSKGRIIKGFFSTHESQQAAKLEFKTKRIGFEYMLSSSQEQVSREYNIFNISDTLASLNTLTHTFYFFHYGLQSRTGFKLGFEIFDSKLNFDESDSTAKIMSYVPKIDLNFAIGLVPDFLYLQPSAAIGYLFTDDEEKETFFGSVDNPWGADVLFEADLSLHIRLSHLDIIGGVSYKYIHDLPDLENFYPHIGISYNLVRYPKENPDVK